jgi:ribonuclease R
MMSKKNKSYVVGTLRVHPRGFGFLIPENRTLCPEDIFVPKSAISGAVDGDKVEVKIFANPYSEKGPEGKVNKIIERGRSSLGATVIFKSKKKGSEALSPLLGEDDIIKLLPADVEVGDRVKVHMLHWGSRNKPPLGEVICKLGHIEDPSCDIKAAIAEFEIESEFSPDAIAQAKSYGDSVKAQDEKGRKDFCKTPTVTIDPETAKDFDDALSVCRTGSGYELMVHIADVSYYVNKGSALDQEAASRCNSVYFPGTVVPMLPHELSSHLCSLKPDVKRLAVTIQMQFNKDGELEDYQIHRSVIKSCKRFTYEEAKEVLDGTKQSPHKSLLELMVELCKKLKHQRALRGSIEFAMPDISLHIDAEGVPTGLRLVEYDITHQMVEEFMLKANEVVATHLFKLNKPLTYRIHEEPLEDNIRDFVMLSQVLGFQIENDPSNEQLQQLFDQARSSPLGKFLATSFIRSMKLAAYSTQNVGHYGLCLEHYTHFTSPIRRYIDLIVHRVLLGEDMITDDLENIALACSEKERLSAKAEQSVVVLKKLRYLRAIVENDPSHIFDGTITKVKPSGFSFEIAACLLEGFIALHGFSFQEERLTLSHGPVQYRTGQPVQVKLDSLDLITLETRWSLASAEKKRTPKKRSQKSGS